MMNINHDVRSYISYYNVYNDDLHDAWVNIYHKDIEHSSNPNNMARLRTYMSLSLFGMGSIGYVMPRLYNCTDPMMILSSVNLIYKFDTGEDFDLETFVFGHTHIKRDVFDKGASTMFRLMCESIYGNVSPMIPLMYVAFNMHNDSKTNFHKSIIEYV